MLRIATVAICFMLYSLSTFGQFDNDGPLGQKVEAMKVAYLTERLSLTAEEAQGFWPLYNEMEEAQKNIRAKYRTNRSPQDMSDVEAEEAILKRFRMEEELIDLQRSYYEKFKQIISPRKIAMIKPATNEFKRELVQRLREARAKRRN